MGGTMEWLGKGPQVGGKGEIKVVEGEISARQK